MRMLFFWGLILSSLTSHAALDHVGVFHRMDKVIILINEPIGGQLDRMLKALNGFGEENRKWISADGTFKISCGRGDTIMGCTIRFLPSENTIIGERDVTHEISLNELGTASSGNIEIYFESSRKDKFILSLQNNVLKIYATKRDGYSSTARMCSRYLK